MERKKGARRERLGQAGSRGQVSGVGHLLEVTWAGSGSRGQALGHVSVSHLQALGGLRLGKSRGHTLSHVAGYLCHVGRLLGNGGRLLGHVGRLLGHVVIKLTWGAGCRRGGANRRTASWWTSCGPCSRSVIACISAVQENLIRTQYRRI
eukprot:1185526-Rhodomonas_salina.1